MRHYRKGVGAVLLNNKKEVFVAERIANDLVTTNNLWQMPQGGIDKDETPQEAVLRELKEEIGTNNVTVLRHTDWLKYDIPTEIRFSTPWGTTYCGQEQIWFFLQFNGKDTDIDLNSYTHAEFKSWKWVPHTQLVDLIVDFKKDLYKKIILFGTQNSLL